MENKKTSIVKKADQAIKTTESWWAFGSLVYNAGWLLAGVTTVAGVMTAALGSIFTTISQYGWAGWFFAGIVAFFTTLTLWLLMAWMVSKRPKKAFENQSKYVEVEDFEKFSNAINEKIEKLGSDLSSQSKDIEQLRDFIFQEMPKDRLTQNKKLEEFGSKIDGWKGRIDQLKEHMVMNFGAIAEAHDAQAALRYFEPMTVDLEELARKLIDIPLCDTWHKDFQIWKSTYEHWVTFPQGYSPEKFSKLLSIDMELLKSEHWTDKVKSISDADELLEYKKFKILYRNFTDNKEAATSIITYKAWNRLGGQGASSHYADRFRY